MSPHVQTSMKYSYETFCAGALLLPREMKPAKCFPKTQKLFFLFFFSCCGLLSLLFEVCISKPCVSPVRHF